MKQDLVQLIKHQKIVEKKGKRVVHAKKVVKGVKSSQFVVCKCWGPCVATNGDFQKKSN